MRSASCVRSFDFNPRSPCGERRAVRSCCFLALNFNPRSPCGERHACMHILPNGKGFQSALPLRGATPWPICQKPASRYFNPRSPCGERRGRNCSGIIRPLIFQSALPLRGATKRARKMPWRHRISIRAPLAGSDSHAWFNA